MKPIKKNHIKIILESSLLEHLIIIFIIGYAGYLPSSCSGMVDTRLSRDKAGYYCEYCHKGSAMKPSAVWPFRYCSSKRRAKNMLRATPCTVSEDHIHKLKRYSQSPDTTFYL